VKPEKEAFLVLYILYLLTNNQPDSHFRSHAIIGHRPTGFKGFAGAFFENTPMPKTKYPCTIVWNGQFGSFGIQKTGKKQIFR
ncbi:MAG: hypothetical protein JW828_15505, partial [Sedimentisphaerales bacterium]|nr:hypothetical protein [Sedimentisphaerales bacterium]